MITQSRIRALICLLYWFSPLLCVNKFLTHTIVECGQSMVKKEIGLSSKNTKQFFSLVLPASAPIICYAPLCVCDVRNSGINFTYQEARVSYHPCEQCTSQLYCVRNLLPIVMSSVRDQNVPAKYSTGGACRTPNHLFKSC